MARKKKNNARYRLLALLTLTFILFSIACSNKAQDIPTVVDEDTGKELFVLHTSTKKECGSTLYVVGESNGIFAKYGIKLEYTGEIASGAEALTAVLNGTNDFEGALPNNLATYVAEGASIKAVTYMQVDPPESYEGIEDITLFRHMRFYVLEDSPIKTIQDLATYKGSGTDGAVTISGRAPSCNSFLPSAALRKVGIDPSILEFVSFSGTTETLQALELGNLDIAGIHPPFYQLAEDSGYRLLFDSHDTGLGQAAGASSIYFTNEFIEKYPEQVQAFVSALKECAVWTKNNLDEAIQLTAAYIGQEITAVHWYYEEWGFPAEYIQPWIDDLVLSGALEEGQITLDDITTTRFQ